MKLVVDMNLSPSWVDRLRQRGFEAVHRSTVGAGNRARRRNPGLGTRTQFVVITNDLDFSAILAATSGQAPSVVQIRTQDLLSDAAVSIVATAISTDYFSAMRPF
jgi:predicted nuclease of predicted toxin-antitoxin system